MSAFNNDIQPTRDDRLGSGQLNENHGIAATGIHDPLTSGNSLRNSQSTEPSHVGGQAHGQLNENHGIAATGLHDPLTSANALSGQEHTHASGLHDSVHTQHNENAPGFHNPAEGKRTGGTGVPVVASTTQAGGAPNISSHINNKHGQGPEIASHVNNKHGSGPDAHHGVSASQGDHGASHHQQAPTTREVDQHTAHHNEHPTTVDDLNRKPSAGEKIKGTLEKIAGKITGDEAKVAKGDNLAHGRTA